MNADTVLIKELQRCTVVPFVWNDLLRSLPLIIAELLFFLLLFSHFHGRQPQAMNSSNTIRGSTIRLVSCYAMSVTVARLSPSPFCLADAYKIEG